MKITDIKPCQLCKGKIAPVFHKIIVTQHMIQAGPVNRFLGLSQMLGSGRWATVMGADEDVDVEITRHEMIICQECFLYKMGDLPIAMEGASDGDRDQDGSAG